MAHAGNPTCARWARPWLPIPGAWIRRFWPGPLKRFRRDACWPCWPIRPALPARKCARPSPFASRTGFRWRSSPPPRWSGPNTCATIPCAASTARTSCSSAVERYRDEHQFETVAYGINFDDQGDYRPGQQAARQHGVAAPLLDAGFTKQDIRDLARAAGLSVWDKPASACLASRIEYGRDVTPEALRQVEAGEDALRALGFRQMRVRHHGAIARIEIARDELARALTLEMAAEFTRIFKQLGFKFVTLDLEGFRSGSMNTVLPVEALSGHSNRP